MCFYVVKGVGVTDTSQGFNQFKMFSTEEEAKKYFREMSNKCVSIYTYSSESKSNVVIVIDEFKNIIDKMQADLGKKCLLEKELTSIVTAIKRCIERKVKEVNIYIDHLAIQKIVEKKLYINNNMSQLSDFLISKKDVIKMNFIWKNSITASQYYLLMVELM